jgi:putative redox protein
VSGPTSSTPTPGAPRRQAVVRATWMGGHRFDSGRPDGPLARFDGAAETGQSPADALLSALATCSAVDVVDILAKRRTPAERLTVDVRGERREEHPRRFMHLELRFTVDGAGIEAVHVERAIGLAFEKYCSVAATLAPDITVNAVAVVNGLEGQPIAQKISG